jgi:hypothetical protein
LVRLIQERQHLCKIEILSLDVLVLLAAFSPRSMGCCPPWPRQGGYFFSDIGYNYHDA